MEIILLERVPSLGQMGDVVSVRPGYARNYLLPQKKALRATKANKEYFDKQKAQLVAVNIERRKDAEKVSQKMKDLKVVVLRQAGETGMLYGSVSGRDIADAVTAQGFTVERRQVSIETPIKTLGLFPVNVNLHPEVAIKVTVNVARTQEEAAVQAEKGTAVILTASANEEAAQDLAAIDQAPAVETAEMEEKPKKKKKAAKEEAAE